MILCNTKTHNKIFQKLFHARLAVFPLHGRPEPARTFLRRPGLARAVEPLVHFETTMGEQLQVDWAESRKGSQPLARVCATLGYSRASYLTLCATAALPTQQAV